LNFSTKLSGSESCLISTLFLRAILIAPFSVISASTDSAQNLSAAAVKFDEANILPDLLVSNILVVLSVAVTPASTEGSSIAI